MKTLLTRARKDQTGGLVLSGVIVIMIVAVFLIMVLIILPMIDRNNTNQQIKTDVDSIKTAFADYINQNQVLPKNWDDVSQINLSHYQPGVIVKSLTGNFEPAGFEAAASSAINQGRDYLGLFARAKCQSGQNQTSLTDVTRPGSENDLVIVYLLKGADLVCEPISG